MAFKVTFAPAAYFPPPATFALFVAVASSPYAATSSVSVGNATSNVAVAISFVLPCVAVKVTVKKPSFVATPVKTFFFASNLTPAGRPSTFSVQPPATTALTTFVMSSGRTPAARTYFPSVSRPAALNVSVVKFGTFSSNSPVEASVAFLTDVLVASTLTG